MKRIPHKIIDEKEHKFCRKCNSRKIVSEFNKCSKLQDKLCYCCRTCENSRKNINLNKSMAFRKPHIFINNVEYKECCTCKENRFISDYGTSKQTWDGLRKECKICRAKFYQDNKKEIWNKEKERLKIDPKVKMAKTLRNRLLSVINRQYKYNSMLNLLGCDLVFFLNHIENQFQE